jgi:YegS/Rv2252/BmrU family lipid kinase
MAERKKLIYFIVNTASGRGGNKLLIENLKTIFTPIKYSIILKHSLKSKDIVVFAEEAVRLFSDIVVACGGDGTIREVAKHTIKNKIKLGIIPLGSGNSLAANLMIPKEKEGALKLIKEGFYRKIDVGYVNQHLFLSNMSLGLGAQLIFHYSKTPMRRRKGYFFALLKTLFKPNIKTKIKIKIKDQQKLVRPAIFFVSNSNQIGYGLSLTPEASLDDGKLDIVCLEESTFLSKLFLTYSLLVKKKIKKACVWRAQVVDFSITKTNEEPFLIQIDGEPLTINSNVLLLSSLAQTLNVITARP